ncbi:iron complex transport system substrate-binding protein [Lysinibacillus parviboronicapiens]|uniref:Iron complex transport system substrate-binding protein n=1 Tax=Lysinibacillus parviboronicapiens TaxID=436516 RepID=A0ABV2PHY4_9BACI
MNYEAFMLLWENTYIKLKQFDYVNKADIQIDTRVNHSTLLVITAGEAEVLIGDQPYQVQSFSIFHIGKFQTLHINGKDTISYYLIHYKGDVMYADAFLQHLYMQYQPFQTNFTCIPANALGIHLLLQDMYDKWKTSSIQEHLSVKASFYELIYRIFQELNEGLGKSHEIDKVEAARLYLEQHIHEPISIQTLADALKISTRHLLRTFKQRFGIGPQIYLQQLRIEHAKHYLLSNHYGIREIAISLGYEDEYYFSRAFKKETNMAPSFFRRKYTSDLSDYAITNENRFQYNENQHAQAIRFESRENNYMMKYVGMPFLLSLLVLLAACGEDSAQTNNNDVTLKTEESTVRTVTDDSGREVEIPVKAERIVTDWYLGQILALDIVPVGAVTANLEYAAFLKPYYKDKEINNIGTDGNTSLEKILELKPDLIITWNKDDAEKYEKIAPTIVFSESAHNSATDEIKAMGEFLGRQAEAEAFVKDFDNRITKAQSKINAAIPEGATFTIFDLFEKNATIVGNNSVSGGRALYQILNMKPQEKVQELFDTKEFGGGRYDVSYEVVGDYVGDYVFLINFFNKGGEFPSTWTNLDVVKNNNIIDLSPEYYFASDPLSGLHQAEDMANKIVEFTESQKNK